MKGKLKEPIVLRDFNSDPVCILPVGFYLDDERWKGIWALHEKLGRPLTHDDLKKLFPAEEALG